MFAVVRDSNLLRPQVVEVRFRFPSDGLPADGPSWKSSVMKAARVSSRFPLLASWRRLHEFAALLTHFGAPRGLHGKQFELHASEMPA